MALLIKLSFLHCIHRICLGLYFAENSIWIATATIHYCFEIKRVKKKKQVAWGRRCGRLRQTSQVDVDERVVSVDSSEPNARPPGAVQARHIAQAPIEAVKAPSCEKSPHDE